jgi:hypothetical protein
MSDIPALRTRNPLFEAILSLCLLGQAIALAADWPQYRGPASDGTTPDAIATVWATNSPGFIVWTNGSLTNGFSTFAVSQGRAFTMMSKKVVTTNEYCVGVDAATGMILWSTPIDTEKWDWNSTAYGGSGGYPGSAYGKGDGPRTTPAVQDGKVFALSAQMHLVCLNATNGNVIWSNDLVSAYGASYTFYQNGASPCLDDELLFLNLNSSTNGQTLSAFHTDDGSLAWSSQAEAAPQATPVVATIEGVRQVVFATWTGLVSLDRTTGEFLWKFPYPFGSVTECLGASPLVYSNMVLAASAYGKGAAAAQVALADNAWTVTQLFYTNGALYQSIWPSPVCCQGYVYAIGNGAAFQSAPLTCYELATGRMMWTANNFGPGGLILVNTNLLVLTDTGQLVLVQPNPTAYVELARYQALQFTSAAPGKCWNNPTFSNGRIYARGTRGSICLDVSVPTRPPLKLLAPQFLNSTQMQLTVGTADGSPLDADRLAGIEVRFTNSPTAPATAWPRLTNPLVLWTNGLARLTNTIPAGEQSQVFIIVEPP